MMKTIRITWGVLAFLVAFVCTWFLPESMWRWLKPVLPAISGSAVPFKLTMLLGYIILGLLSGFLAGVLHGIISPWRNKIVMVSPAILVLFLFFADTLWLDGLGPQGRWQFRHVHLPYHLPEMVMLVVGTFVGSIAGQSIKTVANNALNRTSESRARRLPESG